MRIQFYLFLILSSLFFIADQFSKYWVKNTFYKKMFGTNIFELGEFEINLHVAINKGVSFSMFSNDNQLPIILLTGAIILGLVIWLKKTSQYLTSTGLSMILGGAIGNLIDRMAIGGVVDFISVSYDKYYFPTFNVADILIFSGVVLIFFQDMFAKTIKKV
ncbi:MAG: signal peptidase II [Alphaproteobacteria bacterium]